MAISGVSFCGADRPRTKLDFGCIAKKVTKIHHPGCCVLVTTSEGSLATEDDNHANDGRASPFHKW